VNDPIIRLETALASLEASAESSLKTTNALVAQLKRIRKIAQTGSVRDLEKALEQAQQLAGATRDAVIAIKAGWRFDARAYMEAGSFAEEILAIGSASGITLQEQDGRVVSYPSLVRILPADEAVEIDRKRTREIRPSHVVAQLQSAQSRPTRFRAEPFLEALLRAYRYVVAEGGRQIGETVRLVDVYKVLTVLPGQSAAYSVSEFVRDIYLLDQSRVAESRDGLTLSLPAASGTRTGSALRAVTRGGDLKTYYGISFRP
jgi:hypothetical protein